MKQIFNDRPVRAWSLPTTKANTHFSVSGAESALSTLCSADPGSTSVEPALWKTPRLTSWPVYADEVSEVTVGCSLCPQEWRGDPCNCTPILRTNTRSSSDDNTPLYRREWSSVLVHTQVFVAFGLCPLEWRDPNCTFPTNLHDTPHLCRRYHRQNTDADTSI